MLFVINTMNFQGSVVLPLNYKKSHSVYSSTNFIMNLLKKAIMLKIKFQFIVKVNFYISRVINTK